MFPSHEGFCPPITGEPKGVIAGEQREQMRPENMLSM